MSGTTQDSVLSILRAPDTTPDVVQDRLAAAIMALGIFTPAESSLLAEQALDAAEIAAEAVIAEAIKVAS